MVNNEVTAMADNIIIQTLVTQTGQIGDVTVIGGGGGSVLIDKTITENGTYNAVDEGADGYSSVRVEAAGEDNLTTLMNGNPVSINDYSITRLSLSVANLRSIRAPNATSIVNNFSRLTPGITDVFAPKAVVGTEAFKGCTTLQWIVCKGPYDTLFGTRPFSEYVSNQMRLETVDFTNPDGIGAQCFDGCRHLTLLILRGSNLCPLTDVTAFRNTAFDSGQTGGTIYIPKALYDHLGDGTALDYKAATNWATLDGYGTITWAQIEASQYENAYADGTPIS